MWKEIITLSVKAMAINALNSKYRRIMEGCIKKNWLHGELVLHDIFLISRGKQKHNKESGSKDGESIVLLFVQIAAHFIARVSSHKLLIWKTAHALMDQ